MWREFFRRGLERTEDPLYSHRLRWDNTAWALRFLAPEVRGALEGSDVEVIVTSAAGDHWRDSTPLGRAQSVEVATFMTPYLLAAQGDATPIAWLHPDQRYTEPNPAGTWRTLPGERQDDHREQRHHRHQEG